MRICENNCANPRPINHTHAAAGIGRQSNTAMGTAITVDSRK